MDYNEKDIKEIRDNYSHFCNSIFPKKLRVHSSRLFVEGVVNIIFNLPHNLKRFKKVNLDANEYNKKLSYKQKNERETFYKKGFRGKVSFLVDTNVIPKEYENIIMYVYSEANTFGAHTGYGSGTDYIFETITNHLGIIQNWFFKDFLKKKKSSSDTKSVTKIKIKEINGQLQSLYESNQITKGLKLSEQYFENSYFNKNVRFVRHFFRFNLRLKNWGQVKRHALLLLNEGYSDEITSLCKFVLFETEMRESYALFKLDKNEYKSRLIRSKRYLNEIPELFINDERRYYWISRWFIEIWWIGGDFTSLTDALYNLNRAKEIKYRWWYHGYKCIVLKQLNHKDFKKESRQFKNNIFQIFEQKPKQPSVRTYCITAFLLLDNQNELKSFLTSIIDLTTPTDFQITILHHIELIYKNEEDKLELYTKLIHNWISLLPRT